ncbi:hypothetical protein [Paraburkholderia caledonica]|uniref:hypothetical protein n=1 Tax=Paraburkholderia caledonica TaxID=134536 RepID=UPI0038BE1403
MYAPLIGQATNLKCVTTATDTSLPYSADQLIVGSSLGGQTFCLSNFSEAISALATGTLAANSLYAVYAYLKSDRTKGPRAAFCSLSLRVARRLHMAERIRRRI